MTLRMPGALLLAVMQTALLAGCSDFSARNDMAGSPAYAMAAPPDQAVEAQPMPEAPPPTYTYNAPPPVQNAAPPQGKFGVQVAAPSSVEEARALIDSLRARYPNDLASQWATILPVTLPKGTFYRVVIGPLPSEQQASQLCSKLRSQGTECFIRRT